MELKKGMYVRTGKGIAQITMPDRLVYLVKTDIYDYVPKSKILKASNNIIDLIEFGDILIYKHPAFKKEYVERIDGKECLELRKNFFKEKSLKLLAIVTKEQLESMQYRVEE